MHAPVRPPPSPFVPSLKCHHLTLREKNVLAKRTHLTPMLDKTKSRCLDHRPDPRPDGGPSITTNGWPTSLEVGDMNRLNDSRTLPARRD